MLGWEYKGTRDRTVSGTLCQRWDRQYPHEHDYHSLSSEQNYCRNPAKAYAKGPWCYTSEAKQKWNYCFVPKCGMGMYIMKKYILIKLFFPLQFEIHCTLFRLGSKVGNIYIYRTTAIFYCDILVLSVRLRHFN